MCLDLPKNKRAGEGGKKKSRKISAKSQGKGLNGATAAKSRARDSGSNFTQTSGLGKHFIFGHATWGTDLNSLWGSRKVPTQGSLSCSLAGPFVTKWILIGRKEKQQQLAPLP